ncbi:hypothetical protein Pdw03_6463 [Penicillium digitatum]|uniref:Uncharacterized protein n=3 Tax=Penicillium digitatum TaxID=36651 RepID=K9GBJ0_PEND2|nr:hypothetical protein PDIP_36280 [Penicillium digitatum Pd1]EKV16295.1 hypothetical protein PDIP_36280 [Penicillium digitatum Pd1]EKV18512.1 hypothetical protein PDIG_08260 [Penicillium digitatum PHI26]QQK42562.1 hypothetical protein Pdw03_6463 [Penicillium digitatum]
MTETAISRAEEFQISFYCRPERSLPWTTAPPFGLTTKKNLTLEIFAHVGHKLFPVSWANFWVLRSGEKIQASEHYEYESGLFQNAQLFDMLGDTPPALPKCEDADEQSWSATSHLFNWHRHYDDGLWLDDGTSKIEDIRRLQRHPWIVDPFHDADRDDPLKEDNQCSPDLGHILNWHAEVQKYYHTDVRSGV